jgi:hypothetical protein
MILTNIGNVIQSARCGGFVLRDLLGGDDSRAFLLSGWPRGRSRADNVAS